MHLRFSHCVAPQQKSDHVVKMLLNAVFHGGIFCADQEMSAPPAIPIKHWALCMPTPQARPDVADATRGMIAMTKHAPSTEESLAA